ncbi:PREDICTED: protein DETOXIFICATION 56 [Tarenaya hassleriana]|uniref:protein DETOXIFICATION 56 n=1 Tax=Tarenaya hassleriana TaxID=28532 RepID=UPI00053C2D13|nr:PREDICTED: protein DETOXIFICATION 56 [Tarenaya hassleriana]
MSQPPVAETSVASPGHEKPEKRRDPVNETLNSPPLDREVYPECPKSFMQNILFELKIQRRIVLPLIVMNLIWFGKLTTTTVFLGRQGELELAGSSLGFTFANVSGFSVLYGLSAAMEPICGQAFGAKNFRLLHKTLLMAMFLLLLVSVPISSLWLNVHKILICFGQREDISFTAKKYLLYLIPDLPVLSVLCPLKAYLSAQGITLPIMFSTAAGTILHVPVNVLLSRAKGIEGVAMAVWITDLVVVILLTGYVLVFEHSEETRSKEGGWWDQSAQDWFKLIKLCGPCCLTVCLEWWCYEILVMLTGRLPNPVQAVSVLVIVLNFDYLLYAIMLSLGTCASTRVANELGANHPKAAYRAAYTSLAMGVLSGCIGAFVMIGARGVWGSLYSHNSEILNGVKKMMLIMAVIEVVNFPLVVCGEIVRGTARPSLGMYANLGGFYLLALPLGAFLAFKAKKGLGGFLFGFLVGISVCLAILLVFAARIDWKKEAAKAQILTCNTEEEETSQSPVPADTR